MSEFKDWLWSGIVIVVDVPVCSLARGSCRVIHCRHKRRIESRHMGLAELHHVMRTQME